MSLKAGDTLGKYEIDSQIGVGGMGEVFLAHDPSLERKVAIKILGEEFSEEPERLARFVREARAASALNHPNILTIFEITKDGNINYIVSEYVEGQTLKSIMKRGRSSVSEALDIAIQAASALASAHDAGIVHRDIKPANIMVRRDGIVKVVDFGIAKLIQPNFDPDVHGEAPTLSKIGTAPGMMIGTPRYMSPEQARGKPVDNRSDIFSLGLVLFELFTGERAFDGESAVDVLSSILKDEAPSVQSVDSRLPKQLDRVIAKCLRKELAHRYHDIRDLLIDLEDLRDELRLEKKIGKGEKTVAEEIHFTDADAAAVTGSLTTGIVKTRRFTLLHALAFVAVAGVIGGGYWWYDSSRHEPEVFPSNARVEEVATWNSGPGEITSNGSFSPDGKLIAFTSTRSGPKSIWVTQTGSKEPIEITKDGDPSQFPIWSPKGDEIAYFSQRNTSSGASGRMTGIWKVSALGGEPRLIAPIADGSSIPRRWGASGKLYFQSKGDLWSVNESNGMLKNETGSAKPLGAHWVGIAADEKTVVAVKETGDFFRIVETDIAGGEIREIASHPELVSGVAWLPDRSVYFYSGQEDGSSKVFAVRPGSAPRRISDQEADSSVVDASEAGVLVGSSREESNIWKVSSKGGDESPIARNLESELWPSVSPDGSKVVFQSVRGLNQGSRLFEGAVVISETGQDAGRKNPQKIAEPGFLPSWSPDGNTIAFLRYEGDEIQLVAIGANGGNEKTLAGGGLPPLGYSVSPYNRVQSYDYSWSPVSGEILFVSGTKTAEIWKADSGKAASAVRLTSVGDPGLSFYCPVWSPDGKQAAFYAHTKKPDENSDTVRSLWTIDPQSGAHKKVFETTELMRLIGWSGPDSLVIAVTAKYSSLPPETVLKRVSVTTGTASEMAVLESAYYYNVALSADGSRIAFAARRGDRDDIWLLPVGVGRPQKLTQNNDSGVYFSNLTWTKNGESVFFGKQTRFSLLSLITTSPQTGE